MCAYSRDWLESNPIDHTKFSAQPGGVRAHKVDVAERLENMFTGFVSGETQTNEGVKNLPFVVQGSDPGLTANKIKLYAKDVSAKAELHAQDEDGNVIQITDAGSISAGFTAQSVIESIYPVGSLYVTTVATNPATVLGFGTWATFGAGKVMVGIDSGDVDFDVAEETGGAKEITLTQAQTPLKSHGHDQILHQWSGQDNGGNPSGSNQDVTTSTNTTDIQDFGDASATAHDNVQPYIVVHMFKRTA